MAIPNIFKKRPSSAKATADKKERKIETPLPKLPKEPTTEKKEVKIKKSSKVSIPKIKEKKTSLAWEVLKTPHITEKATALTEKNQYVFRVFPKANKSKIKKAIEDLYGIDVVSVKVINISPKKRRLGKISGYRSGYKKAIIKIKEGQKIEIMPR